MNEETFDSGAKLKIEWNENTLFGAKKAEADAHSCNLFECSWTEHFNFSQNVICYNEKLRKEMISRFHDFTLQLLIATFQLIKLSNDNFIALRSQSQWSNLIIRIENFRALQTKSNKPFACRLQLCVRMFECSLFLTCLIGSNALPIHIQTHIYSQLRLYSGQTSS